VQADRKGEVPEVIGRELQLPSFRREVPLRYRHHACVVDQDVERSIPVRDERGHRTWIREIESGDYGGSCDVGCDRRPRCGVPNSQRHLRASRAKRPRGLATDARRGAGYDRPFATEVDPRDDVCGG
jgi:hypothetical protein